MSSSPIITDQPLWTEEGPTYYHEAFEYHRPWAKPGPYNTPLTSPDELDFQDWVTTYDVPFDVTAAISDYDMRGYWLARVKAFGVGYTTGEHFPDTWKTPYDTSFSAESIYAREGCPYHWRGDKLVDENNGLLLFWAGYVPPKDTAVGYIEKSKLDPNAITKGLMGDDLDLQKFALYVSGKLRLRAIDQIMDATVVRTITGASTVAVQLNDDDRTILRSGRLSKKLDFELDGLWFRLANVSKDEGDTLTLTFETREIAILRMDNSFIMQKRDGEHTRAGFILRMIREANGLGKIPVMIPDLNRVLPIQGVPATLDPANPDPNAGIPTDNPTSSNQWDVITDPRRGLTVKGHLATKEQIQNVNLILGEGTRQGANRKCLVCSIMTAIDESEIKNLLGGDLDSVGLFQQRANWGTVMDRTNPTKSAAMFYHNAIRIDREHPDLTYNDLCQSVQNSGTPDAYGQYKGEAENWVTAYTGKLPDEMPVKIPGDPTSNIPFLGTDLTKRDPNAGGTRQLTGQGGDQGVGTFVYYRGVPGADNKHWGKEDSWACIQRLASEINWLAFFVGGTFWYVSYEWLFEHMKPLMNVSEASPGVHTISFDYDNNKKVATINLKARIGRWIAQPGALVILHDMGPVNGRWLVQEFERSLFDLDATITLIKPLPELPEQIPGKVPNAPSTPGVVPDPGPVGIYKNPFRSANLLDGRIDNGVDFSANNGDPIYAIGPATITYYNQHDSWGAETVPLLGSRIAYTFMSGPAQGLSVFVAEYIDLDPNIKLGSYVDCNTVIATFAGASQSYSGGGIETGWAMGGSDPNPYTYRFPGSHSGWTTWGKNFSELLAALGCSPSGRIERSRVGPDLPASWPSWSATMFVAT